MQIPAFSDVQEKPDSLSVNERFDNLIICPVRLATMLGKRRPGEVKYEDSEQSFARRRLLQIEKIAIDNKRLRARTRSNFTETVSHQLHALVLHQISEAAQQTSTLFSHYIGEPDKIALLLELISIRAGSIARLQPVVASIPWLRDELIAIVNAPSFKRTDTRGRIMVVDNLRTALSFLGMNNLRSLLPALLVNHILGATTSPFHQLPHRTRQFATATAVTARVLAEYTGQDPHSSFMLGMLSNLGSAVVSRLYLRVFDDVHRALLQEALQQRQRDVHEALVRMTPSTNYLIALKEEFAGKVSADLVQHIGAPSLNLNDTMRDLALSDCSPEHPSLKLISQAREYSKVRMLHRARLITKEESKAILRSQQYPAGSLEMLKSTDIFTLPLLHHARY